MNPLVALFALIPLASAFMMWSYRTQAKHIRDTLGVWVYTTFTLTSLAAALAILVITLA